MCACTPAVATPAQTCERFCSHPGSGSAEHSTPRENLCQWIAIQPQSPLTPDVFALPPQLLPGEGLQVSQSHWAYDPNSIHDAFFQHYWERDDSDLGIPSGLHLLDGVTLRGCDFSITNQELRDSISSTKTSTCVVADGWAQPEMAALCAPMLDELTALWNDIFLRGQQVPDCFGRAKV